MPRQNRVTPFSTLIATPARGTLTGNRGCLHDDRQEIRRQYLGKRWIICLLEFKGRKRAIMTPGHYTELFFLDEATALAAGHRPCAECQRERFERFRDTWAIANPELCGTYRPTATALDAALHLERTAPSVRATRVCDSIENLPNGVFVTDDGQNAYLVLKSQLLRWSPAGYDYPPVHAIRYPARVLTPASIVRTLAADYPVGIHASAFQGAGQGQSLGQVNALVTIRKERPEDIQAIRAVNREAFGQPQEGQLVDTLRTNGAVLLSLVAILDDRVVGHILYSPVSVGSGGEVVIGAGLGPLAVLPEYQRQGIGGKLIESGNRELQKSGCPFIVVLGHPEYYPRFGFKPASSYGIRCQWDVPEDVFMALFLDPSKVEGVSGLVKYRQEFSIVE